jgi:hypothetical protein
MRVWPYALCALILGVGACPGGDDETTTTLTGGSTMMTGSTGGATEPAATEPALTEPTTGTASSAESGSGSADATGADVCASRPAGGWNDCAPNGMIDNDLCGYVANGAAGEVSCLSPTNGPYGVCGIRDCVDDCDCWAPPATGDAIATCTVVFGGGGKGCVLYCVNGQTCPDGMECVSGTCYWPH